MFRLEVNALVVEIAADYSQIRVGRAKPLTSSSFVVVLLTSPRRLKLPEATSGRLSSTRAVRGWRAGCANGCSPLRFW